MILLLLSSTRRLPVLLIDKPDPGVVLPKLSVDLTTFDLIALLMVFRRRENLAMCLWSGVCDVCNPCENNPTFTV